MAQRTIIELTDDLTGGAADESIRFAFDGKAYTIDLSAKNAEKMRKVLTPYLKAARRDGATTPTRSQAPSNGVATSVDSAAVRAWAASNGYQVSSRGRISSDVVAAYREAGN